MNKTQLHWKRRSALYVVLPLIIAIIIRFLQFYASYAYLLLRKVIFCPCLVSTFQHHDLILNQRMLLVRTKQTHQVSMLKNELMRISIQILPHYQASMELSHSWAFKFTQRCHSTILISLQLEAEDISDWRRLNILRNESFCIQ